MKAKTQLSNRTELIQDRENLIKNMIKQTAFSYTKHTIDSIISP